MYVCVSTEHKTWFKLFQYFEIKTFKMRKVFDAERLGICEPFDLATSPSIASGWMVGFLLGQNMSQVLDRLQPENAIDYSKRLPNGCSVFARELTLQ